MSLRRASEVADEHDDHRVERDALLDYVHRLQVERDALRDRAAQLKRERDQLLAVAGER